MDRQTEIELIDEILALKAKASPYLDTHVVQKPVTNYTDAAHFEVERDRLFATVPMAAAHISDLAEAGAFYQRRIAGKPILLTRDKGGKIRAFLNVCRHRGTQLVEQESGCKNRFACPYHAWTYDSAGKLISAPHFDSGFPDMDKQNLGLTQLPCRSLFGIIWVGLTADADLDFDAFFADIANELSALGMADMVVAEQTNITRKANWKILVEGGIESYHFKVAHRATIGPYFEDNLSSYRALGPHLRSILPRSSIAALNGQNRDDWRLRDHANVLYSLFPSCQLLVQQDHIVFISQSPNAADETAMRLCTLVPQEQADKAAYWARNHAITMTTLDEDFAIGESIQTNLDSGANSELTFGRFEGALAKFNQTVEAALI